MYYLPIPVLRKNPQPMVLHGSALGAVEATVELTYDWKNTKTCSLKSEKTFECISLRSLSFSGDETICKPEVGILSSCLKKKIPVLKTN